MNDLISESVTEVFVVQSLCKEYSAQKESEVVPTSKGSKIVKNYSKLVNKNV